MTGMLKKLSFVLIIIIVVLIFIVIYYHYLIFFLGPGFHEKIIYNSNSYKVDNKDDDNIKLSFLTLGHIRNFEYQGNELIQFFYKMRDNKTNESDKIFCDLFYDEINNINDLNPDLLFITGDIIPLFNQNPFWKEDRNIEREKKLFELFWCQIYQELNIIKTKVVIIPGNHEIYSNVSREIYKEKVGLPYYSFKFKDSRFIILNSIKSEKDYPEIDTRMHTKADKPGIISKNQLEFLERGFATEWTEEEIFIFTHFDPFDIPNWWDEVSSIIKNTNCTAVFSGTRSGTLGYECIDDISYFDGGFDKEGVIPSYYVLTTIYENNDIQYNIYHTDYNVLTAINIFIHNWEKIPKVFDKIINKKH